MASFKVLKQSLKIINQLRWTEGTGACLKRRAIAVLPHAHGLAIESKWPQLKGVFDDHINPVDVIAGLGAIRSMGDIRQLQG